MLFIVAKRMCAATLVLATAAVGQVCAAAPRDRLVPVASMYRNFAWEALSSDSDVFGEGLAHQPVSTLSQFFDKRLAKMIVEESACQQRTQAICTLDFDLLFNSQDPRVVDLRIALTSPNTVDVTFKDPVTDKATLITYTVARQADGWRISDVLYREEGPRSLRTLLAGTSKRGVPTKSK
ncbi:hypothetical protein [Massilia sp. DWR3-1-1]|uniref:hypothetical protein n=1 Tax=Massilia sp. DWR3-1-1 TaxID=2804559 RepID=UPI003CF1E513